MTQKNKILIEHIICKKSSRKDSDTYFFLSVSLCFTAFSAIRALDCNVSSQSCSSTPWFIVTAFSALFVLAILSSLKTNFHWGSRVDIKQRRLYWWHSQLFQGERSLSLDDVASINVRHPDTGREEIFFYGIDGAPMSFPGGDFIPDKREKWAMDIAELFPHISVKVTYE